MLTRRFPRAALIVGRFRVILSVMVGNDVTRILNAATLGDPGAAGRLLPLVYDELRRLAAQRMVGERPEHTLQATALVHEAYLRLVGRGDDDANGGDTPRWDGRGHFFAAAAEAMRRILIEHARAREGPRRGGGRRKLPLDVVDLASDDDPLQVLALDEAFSRLELEDPDAAAVARLRFYAGLSVEETATALGSSPRTVKREWAFARAWLLKALQ
jgi:RNA polymerase sigma factor (TIGR02999 family)